MADFSSSVRGLLAQNAAPPAAADTAVVPVGAVMAPVVGVMASAMNTFAGVGRPVNENLVRLGGLMSLVFPNAGPLVTFGAQSLYMLLYGRA
ncbi:hypothetical protein Trihar35433_3943 [Trichoderma harzianum]|nr:hypothetical protein Trihar35433_3943 [Trichoderma harzianum]